MRRYLVVADQTLLGGPLMARAQECLPAGPCQFPLVVPATPARARVVSAEGQDCAVAAGRPADRAEPFRPLAADVVGEVGDAAVAHRIQRTFDVPMSTVVAGAAA